MTTGTGSKAAASMTSGGATSGSTESTGGATVCCPALLGRPLTEVDAEAMATLLKALADPVRLRLLSLVATSSTGELCACDLPEALGRSQATISHHLGLLVKAGVLTREQRGKWAWFRIRTEQFEAVRAALAVPT